jgi:hypothetical protein
VTDPEAVLALEKEQGLHVGPGITIHLCGSVCGGTGSGMFLDLAFDLRRWAERHTTGDVTVVGHLVLPEAFRGKPVVDRALQANSYIALQELDHFMNARADAPWEVEYSPGEPESSRRAPFDSCYLLSGGQNGSLSIEDLTSAIGEAVVLLTSFEAGHIILKGETNTANQSKAKIDPFGRSCCYSSYGVIGVDVPSELVADHLVDRVRWQLRGQGEPAGEQAFEKPMRDTARERRSRLEERFNERKIRVRPGQVEARGAVERWNDARNARAGASRGRLGWPRNGGENPQAAGFESEARQFLARAMSNAETEVEKVVEGALANPLLDADGWLEGVLDESSELLSERRGGRLADLIAYVDLLQDELRRLEARTQDELVKTNGVSNGLEGGWQDDWWSDVTRALQEHWLPFQQARADGRLLARYRDEVAALRERLAQWGRRLQLLLAGLRDPRPRADSEEKYNDEHRGRSAVVTIESLVSPPSSGGEGLLDARAAEIGPDLVRDVATDRRWLTRAWPESEMEASIDRECRGKVVRYLEREGLNDCERLLERVTEGDPEAFERRLLTFWERARPSWSVSETYTLRNNVLEVSTVGAVRGSGIFGVLLKRDRRVQATSSQCPAYVPILCTQHGMSLLGLRTLPDYRSAFLEAVQHEQRFDFHFFLDTRWVTEIEFPDEPREDLDVLGAFSLAVDLELVAREGDGSYRYADGEVEVRRPRRWQMFEFLRQARHGELQEQVAEALNAGAHANGTSDSARARIAGIQLRLMERAAMARRDRRGRRTPEGEVNLSRDLFQLHREIRSCRFRLRPLDTHPEDDPSAPGHEG